MPSSCPTYATHPFLCAFIIYLSACTPCFTYLHLSLASALLCGCRCDVMLCSSPLMYVVFGNVVPRPRGSLHRNWGESIRYKITKLLILYPLLYRKCKVITISVRKRTLCINSVQTLYMYSTCLLCPFFILKTEGPLYICINSA